MVLLVVDTQEMIMTNDLYMFDSFVENVAELIETARENDVEVVYVRHDDGIELTKGVAGFDVYSRFAPRENERIFDKSVNSAFKQSGLLEYLQAKKENQIMIVGIQTEYCIDATIKCGFEHGFEMIVPAYCNTTDDNEYMTAENSYKYYNEKMWNKRYAKCISFESALEALKCRKY